MEIQQPENSEYQDVIITHLELNSTEPTNPRSILRQIIRSLRNKRPGMAHGGRITKIEGDEFEMVMPLNNAQTLPNGKRIRYLMPKGGVPIFMGKDASEKLEAMRRKGLIN